MASKLENQRVMNLTDAQLLQCMRGRGDDLSTLRAFEFLIRMFDTAGKAQPAARVGLSVAAELVKLYGQNFAAGHEMHPFKDFQGSVASILQKAALLDCQDAQPRPPRQKKTLVVDNGARADSIRESLAARAMQREPTIFVVPPMEPSLAPPPPIPLTAIPLTAIPLVTTLGAVAPKPTPPPKLVKVPFVSKRQVTADMILSLDGEFGMPRIYGEIARKGLDTLQRTDVMNALDMLKKQKKIESAGFGLYRKVSPRQVLA